MKRVRGFLCLVLILSTPGAWAGTIRIEAAEPSKARLVEELAQVRKNLPPLFEEVLSRQTLTLVVRKNADHASTSGTTIVVPEGYVEAFNRHAPVAVEIYFGKRKATSFKDMNMLLHGALVHELGHIFDQVHGESPEIQSRQACRPSLADESQACAGVPPLVSRTSDFLNVFEWQPRSSSAVIERGQFSDSRSPERYEFTSPEEAFAVHLGYFVLDRDYKCRLPSRFAYFQKLFRGFDPYPEVSCGEKFWVVVKEGMGFPRLRSVSINDLYEIHQLWAGPTTSPMSRFGHSMYRLVICAPHHAPSKKCREDLAYHLTVNFVAELPTESIDALKGMSGAYPLMTTLQPFVQTTYQYNDTEFRPLYSLPLALSREEKRAFLERLVERSWFYEGRYYFLSRNCATEAVRFLKSVSPEPELQAFKTLRPDRFFSFLREHRTLVNTENLEQELADESSGLYFKSNRSSYDRLVRFAAEVFSLPKLTGVDEFDKLRVDERKKLAELAVARAAGDPMRKKLLVALLVLEERLLNRMEVALITELRTKSLNGHSGTGAAEFGRNLDRLTQFLFEFRSPSSLLQKSVSYGIPTEEEIESIRQNKAFIENLKFENQARAQWLKESARTLASEAVQEREESEALVERLKKAL